jgi:Tol biopolymer transport system component
MLTVVFASMMGLLFAFVPQPSEPVTPAYACTPNGGQVTLSSTDVTLLDTATGNIHVLVTTDGLIDGFEWSPDGKRLAVEMNEGDSWGIYTVDVSEAGDALSEPERLIDSSDADENGPRWSPDGRRIAYFAEDDIYVANADGSDAHLLLEAADGFIGNPRWTADSTVLLAPFTVDGTDWSIKRIDVETGDVSELAQGEGGYASLYDVSPAGIAIVEVMNQDTGPKLLTLDTSSGEIIDLETLGAAPTLSPDGTRFSFLNWEAGSYGGELIVMPLSGSFTRLLTGDLTAQVAGAFSWSPDGTRILFTAYGEGYPHSNVVHILNMRTLKIETFDNAFVNDTGAWWRPCAAS